MEKPTVALICNKNDKRMAAFKNHLLEKGFTNIFSCEKPEDLPMIKHCDHVILPTPVSYDQLFISQTTISLLLCFNYLSKKQLVFGGSFPKSYKNKLTENDILCLDFMELFGIPEGLAIATAEGLVARMISDTPILLSKSSCFVLGFGRCGKCIARLLRSLGAKVTLVIRKTSKTINDAILEDFKYITYEGYETESEKISCDYLINTVAVARIDEAFLKYFKPKYVYEIASNPGGFTDEAKLMLGKDLSVLPGLPGIYAPDYAGYILAKAYLSYITSS